MIPHSIWSLWNHSSATDEFAIQIASIYLVGVEFAIRTNVEQTAGGVVRTGSESVSVGEELDGVDVGFVSSESLHRLSGTDIPQLGEGIAGARNENVLVCRVDADRHHVAKVISEFSNLRARFDIPQHASHVAGRRDDSAIVDEPTAREVAGVSGELTRDTGRTLTRGEVVDRANVVETTAGDVVSTRGIGTGHHP